MSQKLEDELEDLRDRLQRLQSSITEEAVPHIIGLSHKEATILGLLLKREQVSRQQLFDALYSLCAEDDEPELKIIDVMISHLRCRLRALDVEIKTIWGFGYRMMPEMKAKVRAMDGVPAPSRRASTDRQSPARKAPKYFHRTIDEPPPEVRIRRRRSV